MKGGDFIGTVKQAIALQDKMSPALTSINSAMKAALKGMNSMESGLDGVSTASQVASTQTTHYQQVTAKTQNIFSAAEKGAIRWQDAMKQASVSLRGTAEQIDNVGEKANRTGEKMRNAFSSGVSGLSSFPSIITAVNQGLQLTQTIIGALQKPISIADSFIDAISRLNVLNDGLRTTEQLQRQIQRVSQTTRTSYQDMMDVFSQIGFAAGDIFENNNDYMLRFSELMTKALSIGGTKGAAATSVLTQLSQALGRGVLQGQELNSVMTSPIVSSAIADYLGVGIGKLKELGSEGKITSGAIVAAMFAAGQEIDATFERMPDTFGDIMQRLKDTALFEAKPIIDMFSAGINSEAFQSGVNSAIVKIQEFFAWIMELIYRTQELSKTQAFQEMAAGITRSIDSIISTIAWLIEAIISIGERTAENWATVEPILSEFGSLIFGIIAAVKIYQGVMAIATIAQKAFNGAMNANIIGIVITAIVILIAWLIDLWRTNIDFRVGVIRIWNGILGFFDQVPIFFQSVGYGIADAFSNAKIKTLEIMESMANGVIGVINTLIGFLNKIPGVSIQALDKVSSIAQEIAKEQAAQQARADKLYNSRDNAAKKAAEREANLIQNEIIWRSESEKNTAQEKAEDSLSLIPDTQFNDEPLYFSDMDEYLERISRNTAQMADISKSEAKTGGNLDYSMKDEEIRYLREITEVEYINNYTTSRPSVTINEMNVNETADVNEVLKVLEELAAGKYDNVLTGD